MPDLMEENESIWELWQAVRSQWRIGIIGFEGFIYPQPMGLDYNAVYAVARTLLFDITPAALKKLQALESYEIKRKPREGEQDGSQ